MRNIRAPFSANQCEAMLLDLMWLKSAPVGDFNIFKPTLLSLNVLVEEKIGTFAVYFVDKHLYKLIEAGDVVRDITANAVARLKDQVELAATQSDGISAAVSGLLCELSTFCNAMSFVFDSGRIW